MEQAHIRQRVNLTVSSKVIEEAKALGINLSSEAETAIAAAVKKAKEQKWLVENAEAIEAYNHWYEKRSPLLKPDWLD